MRDGVITADRDWDDARTDDFGDLQVAVVGIPMDLGVSNRTGSRFGPRAV
ncbi:arginase family protein, partial [Rhizobium leguminosarum]